MRAVSLMIIALLCLSISGYGAPKQNRSPSIASLIRLIKQSKGAKREKALKTLKQQLKGLRRSQRRQIMQKLQHALHTSPHKKHNLAAEILGAHSDSSTLGGNPGAMDSGVAGGGFGGGMGGSGGMGGGGGHGGGGGR